VPETSRVYRAAARIAERLVPLGGRFVPKLLVQDRERRGAVARWETWAETGRDLTRPLLWCHAPSVGEGLQAEAVLRLVRERRPDVQIAYSFFSPSAGELARRQPADVADYLPYDTSANVEAMLAALRPSALVFTKLDVWPELATRAAARQVRTAMIAATVSPVSSRLRPVARAFGRPGYASLERVGAISEADAGRLRSLGVRREALEVTGDPRFDSALRAVTANRSADSLLHFGAGAPTLVAGSTWPPDEDTLLDAFAQVRANRPEARLILVPHEPTGDSLDRLSRSARRRGFRPALASESPAEPVPLLVVDRVGVLAGLYRTGVIAYVGGGFGRAGLHSVLEPAAHGIPVLFGPRWQSSRDARLLLEADAARALTGPPGDETSRELARVWSDWLAAGGGREARGRRAREVVQAGTGADRRNAALVEALLPNDRESRLRR
jgi:3-deoxy-D-manno-octulosonic-acid transferase